MAMAAKGVTVFTYSQVKLLSFKKILWVKWRKAKVLL